MTDLRVAALRCVSPEDAGTSFGSGYLVADRLVLTAAHVAGAVGQSVEVRLDTRLVTGTVIWRASGADGATSPPDAALIEIDDEAYRPPDLPPVRWGWIAGRGPAVGCTATGYPDALVTQDGRAEPEQVRGEIMPLTRDSNGLADVLPSSWPQPDPDGGTLWSGMSGAAVLSDSGHLVIAVLIEISENFDDRRLTALRVAALRRDHSFTDLVERHTGRPLVLEPVELEATLRPWHRSTRPQSPIALLRPEYEVAPFHGRAQTLGRLVSWCESGGRAAGLLVHAAGGTGKTRLARELAQTMYRKGWVVGELSDAATTFTQFTRLAHPALVLIDYAESRAATTAALLRHIAEHPGQHPVRVLMLARSAGPWWEQLMNDAVVAATLPDEPRELGGLEFSPDSGGRLTMLADAFDTALRQVPGYEDHQQRTPAFQLPWALEPMRDHHPLTLHIAVLASVLTGPEQGEASAPPARVLLRHEKMYWSRLAAERSLGHPETRDAALVFGLLCGAHSRQQAALTMQLLPGLRSDSAEDARRALAHWIATLYPPNDPRAEYWGQLAPDWLFEHLLAALVADEPDLLDNLASLSDDGSLTCLTGAQLDRAVTVLTAAAAHSGEAAAAVRRKLIELVAVHNGVFVPYACLISMQAQYPEPLLTALKILIEHPAAELPHLYEIRRFMPPTGGVLADLGVAVQQRMVAISRDAPASDERERRLAHNLDLLGIYLARVGRIDEALSANGEAVAIHRALDGGDPEIQDGLARALTNHSTNLARAGSHEESYEICQEVVDLLDHSALLPEQRRRLLVRPLNNIFLYHEQHGDTRQAYEVVTRAVTLQREELADGADRFERDTLAQLLTNRAKSLDRLGRPAEALADHEECMEIFRSLYRSEPGVYADRVQAQAMLLAGKRQGEGRHAEAAALYGEAGEALTRLPLRDPGRQLQLGLALQLQAQELSLARAPFASVVHLLERSCAVLGSLFRQDPEMIADPYFDLLKHFVQGAQLVAEDIDIKPYMAEVAGVLDHIVSRWEAAGRIPGVVTTVGNLAMYVSWAIEEGDLTSAIRLCERVEAIAPDDSGATAHLDRENFHATMMMLRAKAMARRGDLPEAAVVATAAAERLDACATPDNPWAAVVAAEGLLDLSLRMSVTDAPRETIALNQAGSAIALRHMAEALDDWTPLLANHLARQARAHTVLGEHEAAANLLEVVLEHVRGLADGREEQRKDPLVTFDIRQAPVGPSRHESLDELLCMYVVELQRLDRTPDLAAALEELVELRRRRWEADGQPDQGLSYAWIARFHGKVLIDTDQPEAAAAAAGTAMAVAKDLPVTDEESQGIRATILHEAALVLIGAGTVDDAVVSISACVEIHRTGRAPSAKDLASALGDLAAILGVAGRTEESFTVGDQALALWRELAAHDADGLEGLAICLHNQALNRKKAGREDEARELRAEFEELLAAATERR
ncbi:trypsin-like peptidase domain-containing protein [Streptomyces sp. NBC_01233]|uniref:trypsin-like peptidase domain-containing protein n=1 Tax=Streptomyces sp. NBC_01233 TaxID=2903787 RepID=UPI002E0F5005|nr:trypsin-like peptidase domain-containing protein [Streptomyces sp. NBC_01233]